MTDTKDVMRQKLEYYYSNNTKVHITKINKEFINGNITGKHSEDIYIVKDEFGNTVKVFLIEVFDVTEWKEKGDLR